MADDADPIHPDRRPLTLEELRERVGRKITIGRAIADAAHQFSGWAVERVTDAPRRMVLTLADMRADYDAWAAARGLPPLALGDLAFTDFCHGRFPLSLFSPEPAFEGVTWSLAAAVEPLAPTAGQGASDAAPRRGRPDGAEALSSFAEGLEALFAATQRLSEIADRLVDSPEAIAQLISLDAETVVAGRTVQLRVRTEPTDRLLDLVAAARAGHAQLCAVENGLRHLLASSPDPATLTRVAEPGQ